MGDNISAGLTTWRKRIILPIQVSDEANHGMNCHDYDTPDFWCRNYTSDSSLFDVFDLIKNGLRKLAQIYFSSPILLAFFPLFVGFVVGWHLKGLTSSQEQNGSRFDKGKISHKLFRGMGNFFINILRYEDFLFKLLLFHVSLPKYLLSLIQKQLGSTWTYYNEVERRENEARKVLSSPEHSTQESGVDVDNIPQHVAVIMDGNRRYGREKYGSISKGHWDGSKKLIEFAKWCLAERIMIVTVYAFSTENWSREKHEVSALMDIISKYCDELREEAIKRGIRVKVLSTETNQLPKNVRLGIERLVNETRNGKELLMNICLSYGSRGEIVNACKGIACDVKVGRLEPDDINEKEVKKRLLTETTPDPDIIIRTSGELRLSNFLLWQLAYTEMFFLDVRWPEMTKTDLLDVIRTFAKGRKRRFGK